MNSDKEKIKIKVCGMTSKENIKKVLDIGKKLRSGFNGK